MNMASLATRSKDAVRWRPSQVGWRQSLLATKGIGSWKMVSLQDYFYDWRPESSLVEEMQAELLKARIQDTRNI